MKESGGVEVPPLGQTTESGGRYSTVEKGRGKGRVFCDGEIYRQHRRPTSDFVDGERRGERTPSRLKCKGDSREVLGLGT